MTASGLQDKNVPKFLHKVVTNLKSHKRTEVAI